MKLELISHVDKKFEMLSTALSRKMDEAGHADARKGATLNEYLRELEQNVAQKAKKKLAEIQAL